MITVTNSNELVDINGVNIDTKLPCKERILDYIRQIRNPYCYLSNGVTVQLKFIGTRTLEECLVGLIENEISLSGSTPVYVQRKNRREISANKFSAVKEDKKNIETIQSDDGDSSISA